MSNSIQILKTRSLRTGDYQPFPLGTGMEVYAAHVSVNIGNYCTQSQKHSKPAIN